MDGRTGSALGGAWDQIETCPIIETPVDYVDKIVRTSDGLMGGRK